LSKSSITEVASCGFGAGQAIYGGTMFALSVKGVRLGATVAAKRLDVHNNGQVTTSLATSQTYTNEGKINSVTYPTAFNGSGNTQAGPVYTYTYDTMSRPIALTDNQPTPVNWATGVVYGPANEMQQISFSSNGAGSYYTETRTYNTRLQLTRMTVPGVMDMEYRFPSQNSGQIYQQKDWVSGEEVSYAYDSLNRLITALTTDPSWGQSFSYDGFGNRTAATVIKGSAPMSSFSFDPATNRITNSGFVYDANGNLIQIPNASAISYDVENRIVSATGAGQDLYAYAPNNKRIWKRPPSGTEEFYFYGITGQKLGTYRAGTGSTGYGMFVGDTNLYFGGKRIRSRNVTVVTDKSGSVRNSGARYFPYGEEEQVTAQDRDKFATYYRDGTTGFDYAENRYYASTLGRFLTPDPSGASTVVTQNPVSWNMYAYVNGDPANFVDPLGQEPGPIETCNYYGMTLPYDCGLIGFTPSPAGLTPFQRAAQKLVSAQNVLSDRATFSVECQQDLQSISAQSSHTTGLDINSLIDAAVNVTFSNGVGSKNPYWWLYTLNPAAAASIDPTKTIGDEFAANPNGLTAASQLGSSTAVGTSIWINPTLISNSVIVNEALLLHESLHLLGFNDSEIQAGLAIRGVPQDPKNTKTTTTQLEKDCVTGKGNDRIP
jgi:RHS repeat-associated protein